MLHLNVSPEDMRGARKLAYEAQDQAFRAAIAILRSALGRAAQTVAATVDRVRTAIRQRIMLAFAHAPARRTAQG
jgi:hypothetical protein